MLGLMAHHSFLLCPILTLTASCRDLSAGLLQARTLSGNGMGVVTDQLPLWYAVANPETAHESNALPSCSFSPKIFVVKHFTTTHPKYKATKRPISLSGLENQEYPAKKDRKKDTRRSDSHSTT